MNIKVLLTKIELRIKRKPGESHLAEKQGQLTVRPGGPGTPV